MSKIPQLFDLQPSWQSMRLHLRPIQTSDEAEVWELYSDPEVGRLNAWTPLLHRSESVQKIKTFHAQYLQRQRIRWGICLRESDRLIGDIALVRIDQRLERAEIGFNLARAYQGNGYMSEALKVLAIQLISEGVFHSFEALCLPQNRPALKMLQRFGFKIEGRLRKAATHQGQREDLILLGLLAEDFQST